MDWLLKGVKNEDLGLPETQREYVWKPPQTLDLLDSLYKDFPVGMILLWKQPSVTNFRSLEGQSKGGKKPIWLILDGQQRITSLSHVSEGKIKVWFNVVNGEFSMRNNSMSDNSGWVRVDEIWKSTTTDIRRKLSSQLSMERDDIDEKYMGEIERVKAIPKANVPVAEITEEDYFKITEIYVRLNEKGTKLKKAEINLAHIVFKYPEKFYDKLQKINDEFEGWGVDTNFLLRCFVCVATNQSKFGPKLKAYLETHNDEDALQDLDTVSKNMRESVRFLESSFGINEDIDQHLIPSNNASTS